MVVFRPNVAEMFFPFYNSLQKTSDLGSSIISGVMVNASGANGQASEWRALLLFFTANILHTIIKILRLSIAGLPIVNAYHD